MAEELGKIQKPKASEFKEGRKLYFVPLIFSPPEGNEILDKIVNRYWDEALAHLISLQGKLAQSKKIFHELVTESGEEGLKTIERFNAGSFRIVKESVDKGAEVTVVEDAEVLDEFMDWGRCLAIGLHSKAVFSVAYEAYVKAQAKRNELIAGNIDSTLGANETAIFIMREGHRIQFAADIQVFYISPPALDEFNRWIREHEEESQHEHDHEHEG